MLLVRFQTPLTDHRWHVVACAWVSCCNLAPSCLNAILSPGSEERRAVGQITHHHLAILNLGLSTQHIAIWLRIAVIVYKGLRALNFHAHEGQAVVFCSHDGRWVTGPVRCATCWRYTKRTHLRRYESLRSLKFHLSHSFCVQSSLWGRRNRWMCHRLVPGESQSYRHSY